MKKLFLKITILVVLFLIPKIVFGNVIINEAAWMGTTTDYNDEWLELKNISSASMDLTGWTLEAVDGQPKITLSGIIPANGYFLLERTDDNSVPNIATDQIYSGAMGNSGEYLKLKDSSNNIIDEVNCSSGWLAGDNTTKQTMERTTTGWQISLNPGGTPKAQNSSGAVEEPEQTPEQPGTPSTPTTNNPPIADAGDNIIGFVNQEIKFDGSKSSDPESNELHYEWNMGNGKLMETPSFTYIYAFPGTYMVTLMVDDGRNYASDTITVKIQQAQITINEFIANPEGKDEEEEWIEIYNDADSITDISGWQLDDMASGSEPFTLPQNTLIAPKSYLVFSRQITKITLNNDQDSVRLLLSDGIVFQEINYEKPPQGKSSARTSDGFVWSEPTPGMANIVGLAIKSEKQTVYQQNSVETQIVKEPSKNYVINLPDNEILGGYTDMNSNEPAFVPSNGTSAGELARIKTSTAQNPVNLALIIITIVFAAGFLGLLLIKFRKKDLAP